MLAVMSSRHSCVPWIISISCIMKLMRADLKAPPKPNCQTPNRPQWAPNSLCMGPNGPYRLGLLRAPLRGVHLTPTIKSGLSFSDASQSCLQICNSLVRCHSANALLNTGNKLDDHPSSIRALKIKPYPLTRLHLCQGGNSGALDLFPGYQAHPHF